MYIIEISENVINATTYTYKVSKKEVDILETLSNYGGFRRFNMSIYDIKKGGGNSQLKMLFPSLTKIFNRNVENILFELNFRY